MMIKSSTVLRNEYNEISNYCKEKQQPVFVTKNGEGDLVVMSLELYTKREEQMELREKLVEAEMQRAKGVKRYSIKEVSDRLKGLIDGEL